VGGSPATHRRWGGDPSATTETLVSRDTAINWPSSQAVGAAGCISSVFAQVSAVQHLLRHGGKLGLDESGHATETQVPTLSGDGPHPVGCRAVVVELLAAIHPAILNAWGRLSEDKKKIKLHVCSSAAKALRIARIREPASSFLFHHCPSLTYRGRGALHATRIREFHGRYAMILRGAVKLR
jgi:hypothetical protein